MQQSLDTKTEEYFTIAEASSFEELQEIMPELEVPKGEKIRFVMQLNLPVAPAFDLAGAELIFRVVMPEELTLIDVYGIGWTTAVIEAEADPAWLPAIGVFLLVHWKGLALAAIGIMAALGFLILSISIAVTAVRTPEAIPEIFKWVAISIGGAAAFGGIIYLLTRPKKEVA